MEARLTRLKGYAAAMANCYYVADQKIAIRDGLGGEELRLRVDDSYGGNAYATLIVTLMEDVIRDVWAFTLDGARKTPSLRNVWSLMQSPHARTALRDWFSAPPPSEWTEEALRVFSPEQRRTFDEKYDRNVQERLGHFFDETMVRLEQTIPPALQSPIAAKLDGARKRGIAHYEMKPRPGTAHARFDWGQLGLTWDELKDFLERVGPLIFDIALLTTRGTHDLHSLRRANQLYAADFWSRVQGLGPAQAPAQEEWDAMLEAATKRLQTIIHAADSSG